MLKCHSLLVLCWTHLFQVSLTQNPVDHETLYIPYHVGLSIGLFIYSNFLSPLGPQAQV